MAAHNGKKLGFIVGHNLPGYLPDGEPDFYPDAESAQFGWADMVKEALDYEVNMNLVDYTTILHCAEYTTPEELDGLSLTDEMSVMIDGRVYWVTKALDMECIIMPGEVSNEVNA